MLGTLKIYGNFFFIPNYWEWLEDALSHSYETLKKAYIYKAIYASLFTYDWNFDIFLAFCESWCSHINSQHIYLGELYVSLWDQDILGGLPIFGKFYDESMHAWQNWLAKSVVFSDKFTMYFCRRIVCLSPGPAHPQRTPYIWEVLWWVYPCMVKLIGEECGVLRQIHYIFL